jgi:hypothetical protein
MLGFEGVPDWLGGAVIGAVLAAFGYVAKLSVEEWRLIHMARAARLASLGELASLLRAGWVSYSIQNDHAKRLMKMIKHRVGDAHVSGDGYEETMAGSFGAFTPEERELHGIIRGITVHSLRPINRDLLDWLKKDTTFKGASSRQGLKRELARTLTEFEAHLFLWHAKYETWIPDHPEHALVYLADEQRHGLGFPKGLDQRGESALNERSWFWE